MQPFNQHLHTTRSELTDPDPAQATPDGCASGSSGESRVRADGHGASGRTVTVPLWGRAHSGWTAAAPGGAGPHSHAATVILVAETVQEQITIFKTRKQGAGETPPGDRRGGWQTRRVSQPA